MRAQQSGLKICDPARESLKSGKSDSPLWAKLHSAGFSVVCPTASLITEAMKGAV